MKKRKKSQIPKRKLFWDYSQEACYHLVFVTEKRRPFFCVVENFEFYLTPLGKCLENSWLNTEKIRADMNVKLGPYCIMPDHFHGLIYIGKNIHNQSFPEIQQRNSFGRQRKNLGSIVRGIKSQVTICARELGIFEKIWRCSYFEDDIWSERHRLAVEEYILNNRTAWIEDRI